MAGLIHQHVFASDQPHKATYEPVGDRRIELLIAWRTNGELRRLTDISAVTGPVLLALASRVDPTATSRAYLSPMPTEDDLMADTGLRRSSIYKALNLIRAAGLLCAARGTPKTGVLFGTAADYRAYESNPQQELDYGCGDEKVRDGARATADFLAEGGGDKSAMADFSEKVRDGARATADFLAEGGGDKSAMADFSEKVR
ncbi:MAG: hypothetical protein IT444_11465, partial [Phycisphaeraceae bacterium]|nr:hypothetical protein [Phycisphaeraceae bacterium]